MDDLRRRLGAVRDPELGATLEELGMMGDVRVDAQGHALVEVKLTTAGCPLRAQIERDLQNAADGIEGVSDVRVRFGVLDADAKARLMTTARTLAQTRAPRTSVPSSAPVIMIASGKGGVGKSSVTANLAVALAKEGLCVGVLDADIWGFSLTRLLSMSGEIDVKNATMQPLEKKVGAGRIKLLSMGLLADADQALLWRGLMVQKAVAQFLDDADWSGIDYLLIDTPPGTGDVVMTLARKLPQLQQLLVTTPNPAAQQVAARSADFARKANVRMIGVVENMSPVTCSCGQRHAFFGEGGGAALARQLDTELLVSLPLRGDVSTGGDHGHPVAHEDAGDVFGDLARRLRQLAAPTDLAGCSARMLDALERALSAQSS